MNSQSAPWGKDQDPKWTVGLSNPEAGPRYGALRLEHRQHETWLPGYLLDSLLYSNVSGLLRSFLHVRRLEDQKNWSILAGTYVPGGRCRKAMEDFAYLTRTALPPLLICSFLVWSPWPLAHSFSLYKRRSSAGNQRSFLHHGWWYLCW